MHLYCFERHQRLLTASAYKRVFDQVETKISTALFLILANRSDDQQPARIGLIAAKKHLKLAVSRNQFKRQVRESFRHNQQQLFGCDIVVMARSGAGQHTAQELRAQIDQAWPRLAKRISALPAKSTAT